MNNVISTSKAHFFYSITFLGAQLNTIFIYLPVNMDIFAEQVGIALIVNSPETIRSAIYYYIVQYTDIFIQ